MKTDKLKKSEVMELLDNASDECELRAERIFQAIVESGNLEEIGKPIALLLTQYGQTIGQLGAYNDAKDLVRKLK